MTYRNIVMLLFTLVGATSNILYAQCGIYVRRPKCATEVLLQHKSSIENVFTVIQMGVGNPDFGEVFSLIRREDIDELKEERENEEGLNNQKLGELTGADYLVIPRISLEMGIGSSDVKWDLTIELLHLESGATYRDIFSIYGEISSVEKLKREVIPKVKNFISIYKKAVAKECSAGVSGPDSTRLDTDYLESLLANQIDDMLGLFENMSHPYGISQYTTFLGYGSKVKDAVGTYDILEKEGEGQNTSGVDSFLMQNVDNAVVLFVKFLERNESNMKKNQICDMLTLLNKLQLIGRMHNHKINVGIDKRAQKFSKYCI